METIRPVHCPVRTGQTITTRYCPPTDRTGARIFARHCHGRRAYMTYRHELSGEGNHCAAAQEMVSLLSPPGGALSVELVGGVVAPGRYAFAIVSAEF